MQDELEAHSTQGSLSVFVYYGGDRTGDLRLMAEHTVVLTTYRVLQSAHKAVRDSPWAFTSSAKIIFFERKCLLQFS